MALPGRDVASTSIFCFALMMPDSYEQDLIQMQYKKWTSIFACDGYAVYSNKVISLADDLETRKVNSSLTCKKGGEFGTALNTDIFFAVWDRVAEDGQYLLHNWTAKVDPDTVFLPWRLRPALRNHTSGSGGVYLNNCKYGLHGPIEVFSREAVTIWLHGRPKCKSHFKKMCNGSCLWGEDMFIDQCLCAVLGVRRDNDYSLLLEDNCDPSVDWRSCDDPLRISFHAFKTMESWEQCHQNANFFDPPPATSTTTTTTTTSTRTTSATSTTTITSTSTYTNTTATTRTTVTSTTATATSTTATTLTDTAPNTANVSAALNLQTPGLLDADSAGLGYESQVEFNCDTAFNNWRAAWSDAKKMWCCQRTQRGCVEANATASEPFDCDAGFAGWENGWSAGKKLWCCQHYQKGCEPGPDDSLTAHVPLPTPRPLPLPGLGAPSLSPVVGAPADAGLSTSTDMPMPTPDRVQPPIAVPAPTAVDSSQLSDCDFTCQCSTNVVNCEQYIFEVFQKTYALLPNACMAGYNVVVDSCPCCLDGGCSAEGAGCVTSDGVALEGATGMEAASLESQPSENLETNEARRTASVP